MTFQCIRQTEWVHIHERYSSCRLNIMLRLFCRWWWIQGSVRLSNIARCGIRCERSNSNPVPLVKNHIPLRDFGGFGYCDFHNISSFPDIRGFSMPTFIKESRIHVPLHASESILRSWRIEDQPTSNQRQALVIAAPPTTS